MNRDHEKDAFNAIDRGNWEEAINHAKKVPSHHDVWQKFPTAQAKGMPDHAVNLVLDELEHPYSRNHKNLSSFLHELSGNLHHKSLSSSTMRRLAQLTTDHNGFYEQHKVLLHPNFDYDEKMSKLKLASEFWRSYERKVQPHHFAAVKSTLSGQPEKIKDHRGNTGSSHGEAYLSDGRMDSGPIHGVLYPLEMKKLRQRLNQFQPGHAIKLEEIIPHLGEYSKAVQDKISNDAEIPKKTINGKQYIKLYRGLNGDYGSIIRNKVNHDSATNHVDNKSLVMPTAPFSSWTTDPKVAAHFTWMRDNLPKEERYSGVVVSKWMPVEHIMHSGYHDVVPGQEHSHKHEKEIVVAHPEGKMKISTGEMYFQPHPKPKQKEFSSAHYGEVKRGMLRKDETQTIINLHHTNILTHNRSMNGAFDDVRNGKRTHSKGPLHVHKLDDGRYLLVDGHHRFAEGLMNGKENYPAEVVSSGYSDYWATPPKGDEFKFHKSEVLEKGFKTKMAGLAAAASILGVPYGSTDISPQQSNVPIQRLEGQEIVQPHPDLEPISYIESRNGKQMSHPTVTWGLNSGTKAIGLYGLMPLTVHETAKKDPDIGNAYPQLTRWDPIKDHKMYEDFLLKNPMAQHHVANSFWNRLHRVFGKDKDRAVYAWNNGITGAKSVSSQEIKNHPYVKDYHKFQNMLKLQNKPQKIRKSEFQIPNHFSMISAQRNDKHNQSKHDALRSDLKDKGFEPIDVTGHYGYQENSFLVPHTGSAQDRAHIESLGREYKQESVLHSSNLKNHLVNLEDPTQSITGEGHAQDFSDNMYTVLPGGQKMKLHLGSLYKSEDDSLYHYSRHADPIQIIDPQFHGTGTPGAEHRRGVSVARAYYYDTPHDHEPIVQQGSQHMYQVKHPGKVLDIASNEAKHLIDKARNPYGILELPDLEHHIKLAGYNGYKNSAGHLPNAVALFYPQQVQKELPLQKSEELEKMSRNVREQRAKVFGTKANPSLGSSMRDKHIEHISRFARRFLNLDLQPSGGKIDPATGDRKSENPKVGVDKPDWRSGKLEAQWNPEAIIHEIAHLMLLPMGVGLKEGQQLMDKEYGRVQSQHGYMQQKRSQGEVQPMAAEQIIRRHLGLPASKIGIPVELPDDPPRVSVEDPNVVIGNRVPQKTRSGETKWVDLIRQSKFLNPENRQRLDDIFSGKITFHPEQGWTPKQQPQPQPQEAEVAPAEPNKLAASEQDMEDLEKGVKQRLWPYNPRNEISDEHKQLMDNWTNASGNAAQMTEDRERLPRLSGNPRMRALHSLSSRTSTRWNKENKEREYLLHRGISKFERDHVLNQDHMKYEQKSSWSPKLMGAVGWGEYHIDDGETIPQYVSAWIPESKIHHVPLQIGAVSNPSTKGPFEHAHEYEVVVDAGSHKLATPESVKIHDPTEKPADINAKISRKLASSEYIFDDLQKYEPQQHVESFESFSESDGDLEIVAHINQMIADGKLHKLKEEGAFTVDSFIAGTNPDDSWLIKVEPTNKPGIKSVENTGPQSVKEAAFYGAAKDVFGLSQFVPKSILGTVHYDNQEPRLATAIKMLPAEYETAAEFDDEHHGAIKGILGKYHKTGLTHMLALMLYILGDLDSHGNNYMTNGKEISLIDHGSSFADLSAEARDDKKQFVPYILRRDGYKNKMSPNDKKAHMPTIDEPETSKRVEDYIKALDADKLHDSIVSYGLDPRPAITRLKVVQDMIKNTGKPDLAVNSLWVDGAPKNLLSLHEGDQHES